MGTLLKKCEMAPCDVTIVMSTRERWQWTCEVSRQLGHRSPASVTGLGIELIPIFLAHNHDTAESLEDGSAPEEWGRTHSPAHTVLCFLSFCKSGTRQCLAPNVDSGRKAVITSQEILGKQLNNSRCLTCLLYMKVSGFRSAAYLLKQSHEAGLT